jgi:hypothetical protein
MLARGEAANNTYTFAKAQPGDCDMAANANPMGAWERHIRRRLQHPELFDRPAPDNLSLLAAQQRDQRELEAFHRQLTQIIADLTDSTESGKLLQLKQQLDDCHQQSMGLAGDLTDQQTAIGNINEIITTALRRALRDDDEAGRLRLIKQEAERLRTIERWQQPLLADLARTPCPIPDNEIAASLLCESEDAMQFALKSFNPAEQDDILQQWSALQGRASADKREWIAARIALCTPPIEATG